MAKVSLQDVALKAGVSTALVSYVLNGLKLDRIKKETAQRILDAAKALNYRPNHLAQSLKLQKTHNIGLVVADIANSFSSQLARIISDESEMSNYTLTIGSSDENLAKFEKLIDVLMDRQADGFIISAPEGAEHIISKLKDQQIPFVLLDRYFPSVTATSILVDNYDASYKAVKRFTEMGKKKIGIIAYQTALYHLIDRVNGAQQAIKDCGGLDPEAFTFLVNKDSIEADMEVAISQLLNQGTEAILFTTNKLGVAGLRQLLDKGIKVPEDLLFTTFDESEAFHFFPGKISYIRQPLATMGKIAFDLLLKQLSGSEMTGTKTILPTEFIIAEHAGIRI